MTVHGRSIEVANEFYKPKRTGGSHLVILASKNKYIIAALIVTMPFGGSKHIEKRGNVTMSFGVVQVD